jgi:hypothetical protein
VRLVVVVDVDDDQPSLHPSVTVWHMLLKIALRVAVMLWTSIDDVKPRIHPPMNPAGANPQPTAPVFTGKTGKRLDS